MKTKLTFLLALTFLFLFSSSVYSEESDVKKKYWKNGKLKSEIHYKSRKREGLATWWYRTGEKETETHYKNGKREGLSARWHITGNKKLETQ